MQSTTIPTRPAPVTLWQKPRGWLGRYTLWRMNRSHSKLTDWGLRHVSVQPHFTVLDVGCGGGRTISKLAALATQGKVYGADFSEDSVTVSKKTNADAILAGRVEIRHASVSQLPFSDHAFDLITAVETHFWWPNLASDVREIFRVTKPGGQLVVIAEVYKGADHFASRFAEKHASRTGITLLTPDEHRQLFTATGYADVQVDAMSAKGWITTTGRKPQ